MSAAVECEPILDPSNEEIDRLIAEFGGDPRQVIRALLHDLTELALILRQRSRVALSADSFFHSVWRRQRMRNHESEDHPFGLSRWIARHCFWRSEHAVAPLSTKWRG